MRVVRLRDLEALSLSNAAYKMKRMFELQAVEPRIFGVDNDHVALLLLLTGCTHNIAPSISS